MQERFLIRLFSSQLENGRRNAELYLEPQWVGFRIDCFPEQNFRWHHWQLSLGGASQRMLVAQHKEQKVTFYCESQELVQILLTHLAEEPEVKKIAAQLHSSERKNRLLYSFGLAIVLLLCWGGYTGVQNATKWTLSLIPRSLDVQLGKLASNELQSMGPELENTQVKQAVEQIMRRLTTSMPAELQADDFAFKMRAIDSEQVNAFALPGGQMVVLRGLIAILESPEQLAAVMAHELSHVTQRHGLKNIVHSVGVTNLLFYLVGDSSQWLETATQLGGVLAMQKYSRSAEDEADRVGVRILHAAQINPKHMADAFTRMREAEHSAELDFSALNLLSSHPELKKRIENVERYTNALGPIVEKDLQIDWISIQKQIRVMQSNSGG